ncbi:MAG: N-acetylmuramoyl-L-alanine amidase LytC [Candidatus Dichloromethanomonas elyunquensis]|nr:MAG: N-acetylmuramoyl-L-alanine amidase LytC [Candidatus Dichloromethanomonas elyunquensis]
MRFTKSKALSVCMTLIFLLAISFPAAVAAETETSGTSVTRLGGSDRYETAALISQAGWTKADNAILSSGNSENLVDALTAAPFAKMKDAPILLTQAASLNSFTEKELIRLDAKNVYVTSGSAVIEQPVLDKLKAMGIAVTQLGGQDRFETSVNIAKQLSGVRKVIVTTAWSNADALSVSSVAAAEGIPILLSNSGSLASCVAQFLNAMGEKIVNTYIIGGEEAIGQTVEASLSNAVRVGGTDRYATNREIMKSFGAVYKPGKIFVANGQNEHLVDSLAGAPFAAQTASPVVLTDNSLPSDTKEYVKKYLLVNKAVALGGETAVSSGIMNDLTIAAVYSQDASIQGSSDAGLPLVVKDNIRIMGKNVTVKNISADYSIYIKGDNATLDNVTVKGSVFVDPGVNGTANLNQVTADKIVVLSGGKDSIHISNSFSGELIVTTSDDAGIPSAVRIELTDTQTGSATANTYAIFDAQTGTQLGTITVNGGVVEFRGTFLEPVIVDGEATIILGDNTTVSSMVTHAQAEITVPPTSSIGSLTTGDTGTTYSGGGQVNGQTSYSTGGGGGGSSQTQLSVTSVSVIDNDGVTKRELYKDSSNSYSISLDGVSDSIKLRWLELTGNASSPALSVSSIAAEGENWVSSPVSANVGSNDRILVGDIIGGLDNGNDGISLRNLRLIFGTGNVVVKAKTSKTGYSDSPEITLTLTLGGAVSSNTIENNWVTIRKTGAAVVAVQVKSPGTTLGTMYNGNFNFAQVVTALAGGEGALSVQQFKNAAVAAVGGNYNDITLQQLMDAHSGTPEKGIIKFDSDQYTVTFTN